jgi:acid stress chaperone HdeB
MHASKHPLIRKFLLLILLALLFSEHARAQVMVDVSKITCDQFATYKIVNPEYIAIWLSGYYHGTRGDMTVDIQTLSADAKKVEGYCLMKPEVPLIQAVKTVLGHLCRALTSVKHSIPTRRLTSGSKVSWFSIQVM